MSRWFGQIVINEVFEGKMRSMMMRFIGVLIVVWSALKLLHLPTSIYRVVLGVPVEITIASIALVIVFWFDSNIYVRKHQIGNNPLTYAVVSALLAAVVIGSVVLHEMGHGFVATLLGHPIDHAGISFWGAYVSPKDSILEVSPLDEVLIAFAGPAVNMLVALVAVVIVKFFGESLFENSVQYVAHVSIRLARLNLLPFIALDGGKTLDGLLRFVLPSAGGRAIAETAIFVIFLSLYTRHRKTHKPYEELLPAM